MRVNIGGSGLEVKTGDVCSESADVLVIPANDGLWMGSGYMGVIKKKGGVEIEQQAVTAGPVNPGEAVRTVAGNLNFKSIIHAVIKGQDLKVTEDALKSSVKNTLKICVENGLVNIVFSDFLDELKGITPFECFSISLKEAIEFLMNSSVKLNLSFIFINEDHYKTGKSELESIFSAR